MSSKTLAHYPIIAALVAAEKFLGPNRIWNPLQNNFIQFDFLRLHFDYCRKELCMLDCIESAADLSVDVINKFLAEHGSSLRLDAAGDGSIYTAAILDVLLQWIKQGTAGKLQGADSKTYDAFTLDTDFRSHIATFDCVEMMFMSSPGYIHPSAIHIQINTNNGDLVNFLIEMPDEQPLPGVAFAELKDQAIKNILELIVDGCMDKRMLHTLTRKSYHKLTLPMISLDQENDISWLCGMSTKSVSGEDFSIAQALQQNKLKMNQFGVRAQSDVAVAIMRTCFVTPLTELIVNSPFFMWLERPGMNRPLFAAYLDYDAWSNPGSLEG